MLRGATKHNYLFLTKNTERYADLDTLPDGENMFYGTSITREDEMHKFNFLPARRNTFVSIEPILEDVLPEKHNLLFRQVDWVIIELKQAGEREKLFLIRNGSGRSLKWQNRKILQSL